MNQDIMPYLLCPECGAHNLFLEVYLSLEDGQIVEGRLDCPKCSSWFRIENSIVDLLPMQLRRKNYERFVVKNERFAARHGLLLPKAEDISQETTPVGNKTKPIGAFEDVVDYEKRVVNNPYYKALDRLAFYDWMERNLGAQDLVLDIGCGPGRQCVPMAERQIRAIGIDIDEEMLGEAVRKIREKSLGRMADFIVADGENPPVKQNSFTACVLYGVLHHLSDKPKAIVNASKKLVPGGLIYSLDPHKSSARFVFDFLMKVWQLYVEEADEDPLITEDQLYKWMQNARINGKVQLSTYLPPHLFVAGFSANVLLLRISDQIFRHIPGIRKIGGVITFEGRKVTEMV
jgi:SAM-dependent methyltransferase